MTTAPSTYRRISAPAQPTERETFLTWLTSHMRLTPFDATLNAGDVAEFVGCSAADVCDKLAHAEPELVEIFECDGEEFACLGELAAYINSGVHGRPGWGDVEVCVRNDAEGIWRAIYGEQV